jgi:hypothetical protein
MKRSTSFRRRGRAVGIAASTIAMVGATALMAGAPAAHATTAAGSPSHLPLPDMSLIGKSPAGLPQSHVRTPAVAGSWSQQNEITGASGGLLGTSIAVSGKTMVVGAISDNSDIGAAYVYTNTVANSPHGWTEAAELTPAMPAAANDDFGFSVAIHRGTIVVGAPCHSSSAQYCTGAAYVFTGSGATWTQKAVLNDPAQGNEDFFGLTVAIGPSSILSGAYGENDNQGAVFAYTTKKGQWSEKAAIDDPAATTNDLFGTSMSVSKKRLVVGAPGTNGSKGAVYVFNEVNGGWVQQATLAVANGEGCSTTCSEPVGLIYGDYFGYSVAINKGTVVVGAPYASYPTPKPDSVGSGAAYVFTGSGSSWTLNTEIADPPEYTANDASPPDCTYYSDPCAAEDQFGITVALLGTTVVSTAPYDYQGYPNNPNGAAFVIAKKAGTWPHSSPLTKLVASDGAAGDYFGYGGVATIGTNIVVIGSPYNPNGAIYFYQD